MRHRWTSFLPLAVLAANVAAQIVAVPPAVNRSSPFPKAEIKPSLLTTGGSAYAVTLAPPAAAELRLKQAVNAGTPHSKSRFGSVGKGVPLVFVLGASRTILPSDTGGGVLVVDVVAELIVVVVGSLAVVAIAVAAVVVATGVVPPRRPRRPPCRCRR